MNANSWVLFTLGSGIGTAVIIDTFTHRLPNWLTLGIAVTCLLLHFVFFSWVGLAVAATGLLVGLLCFLPFHLFGAMGAGDVKLMAATGAALGPRTVLLTVVLTIIAGGCIALVYIGWKGSLGALLNRYGRMLRSLAKWQPQYLPPAAEEAAAVRFPYALAIACGTAMSIMYTS